MKFGVSFLLVFIYLFPLAAQEWLPVDSKLNYCVIGFFTDENEYLIIGDTTIQNIKCSIVEKTFHTCDFRPKTEYIYKSEDDKLYFFNQHEKEFSLLYDFGAEVDEIVEIPLWHWVLGDTLRYKIDCITEELIGNKIRKKFYVSEVYYNQNGELDYETQTILKNNIIIEDFGRLSSFFHIYETGFCDAGYELPLLSVSIPNQEPIIFVEDCENLDYYAKDVCTTSSIEENNYKIKVFPNPATSQIIIEGLHGNEAYFELVDLNGKVVISKEISDHVDGLIININSLPNSVYHLLLKDGRRKLLESFKVVKVD
jgi:hypothetical protein